jgi:serine/threonine-protein kinase
VVHRDLKPENIFLRDGGAGLEVKLVDFGIAKRMDDAPDASGLTTTGTLVGTPQYMSPEQARGRPVDGRTDIYALGAIAFELFLEGAPFSADNVADMVTMQLRATPPPPREIWPDIPPALEALLLAMLAKRPDERPSLAEVQRTLRALRVEIGSRRRLPRRRPMVLVPPAFDGAPTWGMEPAAVHVPPRRRLAEVFGALAAVVLLAAACATVTELVGAPGTLLGTTRAIAAPSPGSPPRAAAAPAAASPAPPAAAPDDRARVHRTSHRPARRRAVRLDPDGTIDPFE